MHDSNAYRDLAPGAYVRRRREPRSATPRPKKEAWDGSGLHVVLLLVALPSIGALAALMVWSMGGTAWQIAGAAFGAWLVVQMVYATQLMLRYLKIRHEMRQDQADRWDDFAS